MSCSLQGESEIVFIRSQSEHVVLIVGYASGGLIWDPQSVGCKRQLRAYQEKRGYGKLHVGIGEAPMTLQERIGILRKTDLNANYFELTNG